ncbi:transcription factor NDT80 [Saccharomyces eubayanus]|uniref:transcription factor NDT80 n=1 Tax=Saccharomyces eubayanus TaxID=1080349 RepID=UPI0006C49DBF|nr:NDT80-like protein [Saccharomyces eubayanus]KOG99187.1 NDT80-like protein [Saccharomyces eubayanus]
MNEIENESPILENELVSKYEKELSTEQEEDGPMILTQLNEDGTTSNYFDKRKLKIAPRSTLQFKVGPPFELVRDYCSVVDSQSGKELQLRIIPRIDRGFDHIDEEWVGYKRNYFTLVSTFETVNCDSDSFLKGVFDLQFEDSSLDDKVRVQYFAIKIRAKNDDDDTEINLVQHTAKRDKGPQFCPSVCPLIPSPLPKHQIIREASNVRNIAKMKKYDSTFYLHRDQVDYEEYGVDSLLFSYPENSIQKVARYERVQFASSISVKKPSQQNKHFSLHVILGAVVDPDSFRNVKPGIPYDELALKNGSKGVFVYLQEMKTPPLIIRGRSPSNYASSQRITVRTPSSVNSSQNNTKKRMASTTPQPLKESCLNARPAKRRSKVTVDVLNSGISSSPIKSRQSTPEEASKENEDPFIRPRRRVETLEHIENKLGGLKTQYPDSSLKYPSSSSRDVEEALENEDLAYSSSISVNMKQIELKPAYTFEHENVFRVGSLAFKKISQLPHEKYDITKEKKCIEQNYSRIEVYSRSECKTSSGNELSLPNISFSILPNSAENFHLETALLPAMEEDVPRTFSRILETGSFQNYYQRMEAENVDRLCSKGVKLVASGTLPSRIFTSEELFEEDSFYKH